MQEEQEEFRDHLTQVHRNSVRLANFCGLITDIGPIRAVKGFRELNGGELLTPELLHADTLRGRRVMLEEGDMDEDSDEPLYK